MYLRNMSNCKTKSGENKVLEGQTKEVTWNGLLKYFNENQNSPVNEHEKVVIKKKNCLVIINIINFFIAYVNCKTNEVLILEIWRA